jgi:hypothetical protein
VGIVVEPLHRVDQAHDRGVGPGVVDHVGEPVVHLATRAEHHRRVRHGGHVARPGLVVVGVAARAEHSLHVDALATDLADEIRDLSRGRDGGQAGAATGAASRPGLVCAAGHGQDDKSDDDPHCAHIAES